MTPKSEYKVNEDGSVTRIGGSSNNGSNNSPKGSSGRNGWIWGMIVAVIIVGVLIWIKSDRALSVTPHTDSIDVEKVDEMISSDENIATIQTFPKSALSDVCTRRRMDKKYPGYILVPDFLTEYNVDKDGWMLYSGANGAYQTSIIFEYDGSAYQFISQLSNGLNSTYSAHKADWAVDSGLFDNQIYYMKAFKSGNRIYCAAFFVPRGDKSNAKLYTRLTEKIFKSTNFPIW